MSAILRSTAALLLAALTASGALSSPAMDAAISGSQWIDDASLAADAADTTPATDVYDAALAGPIQLTGACETTCSACNTACDSCCGCGDGCNCGDPCCGQFKWYASAGVIFLKRDRPAPGTVVAANPGGTPFSRASDFSFDWDPGIDVSLARRFSGGNILEGRYFGVDSTDRNSFITPGSFIGAGFTGPAGTNFNGKYLSMLDSTEINLRHAVNNRLTLLGGFRWVELKDEMFYKINGNVATGDYEFNNRLYGGQLGASLNLSRPTRRLMANIETKAGVYANVADGGIFEYSGNNFIGSFNDRDTTTSFVGEIDFTLGYRLTQHVVLRSGYQLLWLDNVALAGDAGSRSLLNPSLLRNIDYNDLFYQGATAGIDVAW
jgi:hypothetical protein